MDDKGQEPSMEDILASIRKILSEDEEADAGSGGATSQASSGATADGDDVLELTPSMAEGEEAPLVLEEAPPSPPPASEPSPPPPSPPPEVAGDAMPMPMPEGATPSESSLLSPPAAAQSVAAFSELANVARVKNVGVGQPDITLEAIVRDMIRPMLASWLEQNLPDMVERLVRKEIERLVSGAEK